MASSICRRIRSILRVTEIGDYVEQDMKGMTLRLPENVEQELVYEAKRRGVSKSSLVREALAAYLVKDPSSPERSARDGFGDIVGIFDGPEDLATNPVHMEGFGRK